MIPGELYSPGYFLFLPYDEENLVVYSLVAAFVDDFSV